MACYMKSNTKNQEMRELSEKSFLQIFLVLIGQYQSWRQKCQICWQTEFEGKMLEFVLWNQWEKQLGIICLKNESFIFIWTTELVPRKAPGLCPDLCKLSSMWFYCEDIYQLWNGRDLNSLANNIKNHSKG